MPAARSSAGYPGPFVPGRTTAGRCTWKSKYGRPVSAPATGDVLSVTVAGAATGAGPVRFPAMRGEQATATATLATATSNNAFSTRCFTGDERMAEILRLR